MKRTLAFVYVLGIFVLGIVIGALGMHLVDSRFPRFGPPGGMHGVGPEPAGHAPFFERMHRDLQLTPEQLERIDAIADEAHAEGEALRGELEPRVRELMERTRQRIREVLTDEQRETFDRISERHRARAERFFLGHGRPGPGRERPRRRTGPPRPGP